MLTGGVIAFAPFRKDGRILDLGTGTGIWAIDAGARSQQRCCWVLGECSEMRPSWNWCSDLTGHIHRRFMASSDGGMRKCPIGDAVLKFEAWK